MSLVGKPATIAGASAQCNAIVGWLGMVCIGLAWIGNGMVGWVSPFVSNPMGASVLGLPPFMPLALAASALASDLDSPPFLPESMLALYLALDSATRREV